MFNCFIDVIIIIIHILIIIFINIFQTCNLPCRQFPQQAGSHTVNFPYKQFATQAISAYGGCVSGCRTGNLLNLTFQTQKQRKKITKILKKRKNNKKKKKLKK